MSIAKRKKGVNRGKSHKNPLGLEGKPRGWVFQVIQEYMLLPHILVTNISTCLSPHLRELSNNSFHFLP